MNITTNDVLYVVLTVCIPYLIKVVCSYFRAKYNNTVYNDAIDAISDAVLTVNQTYVDELKKQGKFDAAAQENARNRAVEIAISTMSEAAAKYCNKVCGSVEAFILDKLEAVISANK